MQNFHVKLSSGEARSSTSKPSVLSAVFGYLVICLLLALDSIIMKLYASGYILTHILVTVMLLLCTRVSRNQGEKADCASRLSCGQLWGVDRNSSRWAPHWFSLKQG